MTKQTVVRYLWSTLVTFAAGAAIVIVPQLNDLTLESIKSGALAGVIFAAVRAGVKSVLELFLTWYASKSIPQK